MQSELVSMRAPLPISTPLPFSKNTLPLEVIVPSIVERAPPATIFRTDDETEGSVKLIVSPTAIASAPLPKFCHVRTDLFGATIDRVPPLFVVETPVVVCRLVALVPGRANAVAAMLINTATL